MPPPIPALLGRGNPTFLAKQKSIECCALCLLKKKKYVLNWKAQDDSGMDGDDKGGGSDLGVHQ